jgi:hypothetical protein
MINESCNGNSSKAKYQYKNEAWLRFEYLGITLGDKMDSKEVFWSDKMEIKNCLHYKYINETKGPNTGRQNVCI